MIYRVTMRVSYCEVHFDFANIQEAGAFMSTADEKYAKGDSMKVMMTIVREEGE